MNHFLFSFRLSIVISTPIFALAAFLSSTVVAQSSSDFTGYYQSTIGRTLFVVN